MVKRSGRQKQRVAKTKRLGKTKKSKTKNYSRKRFYKRSGRSKRLMLGGWGAGGGEKPKMGGFYQTGGWGGLGGGKLKIGGNHHHMQHGGNPHVGGWQ